MKLTDNQKKALSNIQAGAVTMRNTGYGSWRIMGPSHPGVVGRVISLGLARWQDTEGVKRAILTDAGRAEAQASIEPSNLGRFG